MTYSLTYPDAATGGEKNQPQKNILRQYWSRFNNGQFMPDYQTGFDLGASDMEDGGTAGFDSLDQIGSDKRDTTWNAQMDGYTDATYLRGANKYRATYAGYVPR